jgi:hypothetical protein
MKNTQSEMILDYIKENGSITPKEAYLEFDCMRLAAQIHYLKKQGVPIRCSIEMSKNRFGRTTRYARYSLIEN